MHLLKVSYSPIRTLGAPQPSISEPQNTVKLNKGAFKTLCKRSGALHSVLIRKKVSEYHFEIFGAVGEYTAFLWPSNL